MKLVQGEDREELFVEEDDFWKMEYFLVRYFEKDLKSSKRIGTEYDIPFGRSSSDFQRGFQLTFKILFLTRSGVND